MRFFRVLVVLIFSVSLVGCGLFGKKKTPDASNPPVAETKKKEAKPTKQIITNPQTAPGKVASVNMEGRFAVITFPYSTTAPSSGKVNVYRKNLKVGEVRITGPSKDNNTVGDILSGEVLAGDEIRPD
jgi:predicted small lipoprotein YifL